MKELVDQGVQGTLLIPTEPIVLHKTTRRVQRVSSKGQAIVGIQQQSIRQRAYGNKWSVLDNKDNKNIKNKERVNTIK